MAVDIAAAQAKSTKEEFDLLMTDKAVDIAA